MIVDYKIFGRQIAKRRKVLNLWLEETKWFVVRDVHLRYSMAGQSPGSFDSQDSLFFSRFSGKVVI